MQTVLHIDMDAFFASVEERDKERLKGRPIVVGSDPKGGKGRGIVSTANYLARAYGIHSAQPISQAWEYSMQAKRAGKPEAVFMQPDMRRYSMVSKEIMQYLATKADTCKIASVDEAYLGIHGSIDDGVMLAKEIQQYITCDILLDCSIGVASNMLVAKIASDHEKPRGLTVVRPEEAMGFLAPLPIRAIPGIGPKAAQSLRRAGITTVLDIQQCSAEKLSLLFGTRGKRFYQSARGIDDRPIVSRAPRKSIGHHHTFMKDTLDLKEILAVVSDMSRSIFGTVTRKRKMFGRIVATVRFEDFTTKTRSHSLEREVGDMKTIETTAMQLLLPFLDSRENPNRKKIRLIGVRVEKLSPKGLLD